MISSLRSAVVHWSDTPTGWIYTSSGEPHPTLQSIPQHHRWAASFLDHSLHTSPTNFRSKKQPGPSPLLIQQEAYHYAGTQLPPRPEAEDVFYVPDGPIQEFAGKRLRSGFLEDRTSFDEQADYQYEKARVDAYNANIAKQRAVIEQKLKETDRTIIASRNEESGQVRNEDKVDIVEDSGSGFLTPAQEQKAEAGKKSMANQEETSKETEKLLQEKADHLEALEKLKFKKEPVAPPPPPPAKGKKKVKCPKCPALPERRERLSMISAEDEAPPTQPPIRVDVTTTTEQAVHPPPKRTVRVYVPKKGQVSAAEDTDDMKYILAKTTESAPSPQVSVPSNSLAEEFREDESADQKEVPPSNDEEDAAAKAALGGHGFAENRIFPWMAAFLPTEARRLQRRDFL